MLTGHVLLQPLQLRLYVGSSLEDTLPQTGINACDINTQHPHMGMYKLSCAIAQSASLQQAQLKPEAPCIDCRAQSNAIAD